MASRTAYSTWTPQKPTLFSGHYLRNRSTLDIGVLGYIGIVQHKEHSPEILSIPPGTPVYTVIYLEKLKFAEFKRQFFFIWNIHFSSRFIACWALSTGSAASLHFR